MSLTRTVAVTVVAIVMLAAHPGTSPQPDSFRFGAAGDFSLSRNFEAVAAAVKASNPDFLVALGDLSYKFEEKRWCAHWKDTVTYSNLVLVSGNHDSGESLAGNINEYVKQCGIPFGIPAEGYGKQYVFDYPAGQPLARFIMVSPGLSGSFIKDLDTDYDTGHQGYKFVADAIDQARSRNIPWVVVAMHKNYVSTLDDKTNEISRDTKHSFMTMLLDKRVDLILQGHEHGYERTHQVATNPSTCPLLLTDGFDPDCVVDTDNMYKAGSGTVIVVLGTGGKDPRGLNTQDSENRYFVTADNKAFGFGEFTVTRSSMSYQFKRAAGGPLTDQFTLAK